MESYISRFAFLTTVYFLSLALCGSYNYALGRWLIDPSVATSFFDAQKTTVGLYQYSTLNAADNAYLRIKGGLDVRPLQGWSLDQVFVWAKATEQKVPSPYNVIIWDKILREDAPFNFTFESKAKYPINDRQRNSLRDKKFELSFEYQFMPIVGFFERGRLTKDNNGLVIKVVGDHKF